MTNDYHEIQRLLHLYCRYLDKADFASFGRLFAHGKFIAHTGTDVPPTIFDCDPKGIEANEVLVTKLYGGQPRSLHASLNAVIDIDPSGETASCESNVLVFQQTESFPLQAIAAAIDIDKFEKVDGKWRFAERRASPLLIGDLSHHLNISVTE